MAGLLVYFFPAKANPPSENKTFSRAFINSVIFVWVGKAQSLQYIFLYADHCMRTDTLLIWIRFMLQGLHTNKQLLKGTYNARGCIGLKS
jgi:hypothetical protein